MQRARPLWSGDDIHRILVFRALQVGDLLCATPALRALRATFPVAHIALIALPWVVSCRRQWGDWVDDIFPFPGHPALPEQPANDAGYAAFVARMRGLQADLAIQLHGSGESSNAIVREFGARRVAGFTRSQERDGDGVIPWPERGSEAERLLALPRALGAPDEALADVLPAFILRPEDAAALQASGLAATLVQRPYVCVHPGARDPARRWPVACFAAVADALADEGFDVVLTGDDSERGLVEALGRAMRQPSINSSCKSLSLGALAQLMKGARLMVCNDTGVSHLAAALKLPSVVVFTRTEAAHIERWAPSDRQRHRVVPVVGESVVEQVMEEAMRLLR